MQYVRELNGMQRRKGPLKHDGKADLLCKDNGKENGNYYHKQPGLCKDYMGILGHILG